MDVFWEKELLVENSEDNLSLRIVRPVSYLKLTIKTVNEKPG